jgi:hypothetical protein
MAWWDVSEWSWADWGSAAWSKDTAAAAEQARSWIESTATAKRWGQTWIDKAAGLVEEAGDVADSNISTVKTAAQAFWEALLWGWQAESDGAPDGWRQLGEAIASAAGASFTEHTSRDDASAAGVIGGTAAASVETARELATDAGTWWDRWGWAVVLVLVLVAMAAILWKVT